MIPETSVQRRAAAASVAGLTATAASMVLQLATVPLALTYWGTETYGVWLAVAAGFMLLRVPEGGYVTFVGNKMNALYHSDNDGLRRTLAAAAPICALIGASQVVAWIALLLADLDGRLLGIPVGHAASSEAGMAVLLLLCVWAIACLYPSVALRLLAPAGLLAVGIWWGLAIQAAQFGAIVLAALNETSILQAASIFAAALAAVYLASARYLRRKLPGFYPWWRGGHWYSGLGDLARSALLTANSAAQQAGTSGVILMVSGMLGAVAVPAFATTRTLTNLSNTLGGVFANALSPELVRYFVSGQRDKLTAGLRTTTILSGLVVNVSLLALLGIGSWIYEVWTNGRISFDLQLFLYLAAAVSMRSAGWTHSNLLAVLNSLAPQLILTLIRTCAALGTGAALIGSLGLSGLALGILIGETTASLLASLVLVPDLIASRGGRLPYMVRVEGFLMSLPLVATAIVGAASGALSGLLILGAVAATFAAAWYMWQQLPDEVRFRARSIVQSRISGRP